MRNKVLAALLAATMIAASAPSLTMAADATPTAPESKGTPTTEVKTETEAGVTKTITTNTYADGSTVTETKTEVLMSGGEVATLVETEYKDAATGEKEVVQVQYDTNGYEVSSVSMKEDATGNKTVTSSDPFSQQTISQSANGLAGIDTLETAATSMTIGEPIEVGGETIDPSILREGALTNNKSLLDAKLDVTIIEKNAVDGTNLREVDASSVLEIGKKAFNKNRSQQTTYLNADVKIGKKAFNKNADNETFYAVGNKAAKKAVKKELEKSGLKNPKVKKVAAAPVG